MGKELINEMQDNGSDIRCTKCSAVLPDPIKKISLTETGTDIFKCKQCGAGYDLIRGVPFLADFELEDFHFLLECSYNLDQECGSSLKELERWRDLLSAYHASDHKKNFLTRLNASEAQHLPYRYSEWLAFNNLTRDIEFSGKKILDVGAGVGFDAYRIVSAGADVTALEFSPVLAGAGKKTLPMVRWFGGASHILPFVDASFDHVVANAALHHMRDIPSAMQEMLRVLKPGGYLITTADSFRPSDSDEEMELEVFNAHPGVLLGVNECIHPFNKFVETLIKYSDRINATIVTHKIHIPSEDGSGRDVAEDKQWSLDQAVNCLSSCSGGLSIKVQLIHHLRTAPRIQNEVVLKPIDYIKCSTSQSSTIARISSLAPEVLINIPFPGSTQDKLQLLNGWQAPVPRKEWRQAYKRARWFLRRSKSQLKLECEVWYFDMESDKTREFHMLLNGSVEKRYSFPSNTWNKCEIDISSIDPGKTFVIEIQLLDAGGSFDSGLFKVKRRRMLGNGFCSRLNSAFSALSCRLGKTIGFNQESPEVREQYHMASCLKGKGRFIESEHIFRNILKETKEVNFISGAYFHLGEICYITKDIKKAVKYLKKCLRLNPSHSKARNYYQQLVKS